MMYQNIELTNRILKKGSLLTFWNYNEFEELTIRKKAIFLTLNWNRFDTKITKKQ